MNQKIKRSQKIKIQVDLYNESKIKREKDEEVNQIKKEKVK